MVLIFFMSHYPLILLSPTKTFLLPVKLLLSCLFFFNPQSLTGDFYMNMGDRLFIRKWTTNSSVATLMKNTASHGTLNLCCAPIFYNTLKSETLVLFLEGSG